MNCFACEYDASWAALTTMARPMVGMAPRQRVKSPSSFNILSMDIIELNSLTQGSATFHQQLKDRPMSAYVAVKCYYCTL